jgi:two-component sensor histidine kinase
MAHHKEGLDRATRIITPELALGLLDALNVGLLLVDRAGCVIHRNRTAATLLPAGDKLDELFTIPATNGSPIPSKSWSAILNNVINSDQAGTATCDSVPNGSSSPNSCRIRMLPLLNESCPDETRVVLLVDHSSANAVASDPETFAAPGQHKQGPTHQCSASPAIPGDAAARVAHELNNPIDAILRYINLAIRLSENVSEPKLHDYLAQSRSALMRMVEIISDMLIGPLAPCESTEPLNMQTVIEDAIRTHLLAAETANIEVTHDVVSGNIHPRHGTRLYQICTNLIRNAIDAMPNGGRLEITALHEPTDPYQNIDAPAWLVIRVADTGVGLPDDVNCVFDANYSTKPSAHSGGLGLSICKEYAEAMGGTIEAAHAESGGAVFTVKLPGSLCLSGVATGPSPASLSRSWAANDH